MIPSSSLRFLTTPEGEEPEREAATFAPEPAPQAPQVFVRILSAPPGWPWEQRRSAELEARHGAPLPLTELLYRTRRMEAWRPGAPARFAAFYVLARDVGERLQTHADVDGRRVEISFGAFRPSPRAARFAFQAAGAAALLALIIGATAGAFAQRAQTETALQAAEQTAAAKLRVLRVRARLADAQRQLDLQLDRGAPLSAALRDVAWASAERDPQARIEALRWRSGVMGLEVRGDGAPFGAAAGRQVERSKAPIRKGVWLWIVTPTGHGAAPAEAPR